MSKYIYFVSMQKVTTNSEDYDCWAFKSEHGAYHLAYIPIDGHIGAMCDDPTPESEINFAPSGEIRIFEYPFRMKLGD